ncbi:MULTISPECIES: hypothetical protein [Providencia]|uniref:hypothetical protein n=1 Tax=Providencia TaxID=586 RepID=UPI0012B5F2C6|nr:MULTISPECIES: hypothetical protein [Providencia]MTC55224.1 hypothetical protein [Providencia rustigianii]
MGVYNFYSEVARLMKDAGWKAQSNFSTHEMWYHIVSGRKIEVPLIIIASAKANNILRDAGVAARF